MLVGIHRNYKGSIQPFTQKYLDILTFNNVDYRVIDIRDDDFWEQFRSLSAFIYQVGHSSDLIQMSQSFMGAIQQSSIPVFPNYNTLWAFDDKVRQHYLSQYLGLDFIESWVFWDRTKASKWADQADYPVIFKLKGGAGSTNVILVKTASQARRLINRAFTTGIKDSSLSSSWRIKYFPVSKYLRDRAIRIGRRVRGEDANLYWMNNKNYVYFQKYLPANTYDTRIKIIGERAFAMRRYNRQNDFRASGSNANDYDTTKIDLQMIKIAFATSKKCGFQSMAYDFLYDGSEPKICEISYSYPYLATYNGPGYWDSALNWHEGHFFPQLFILQDLLRVELKQPDVNQ